MQKGNTANQLGQYLHQARMKRGLSLRAVATPAGLNASYLMRLERGEYASPDPRHLRELARVLELATADLLVAAGLPTTTELPGFEPYLRAKYDLPEEAIDQLAAFFDFVNQRPPSGGPEQGGGHGRDHS